MLFWIVPALALLAAGVSLGLRRRSPYHPVNGRWVLCARLGSSVPTSSLSPRQRRRLLHDACHYIADPWRRAIPMTAVRLDMKQVPKPRLLSSHSEYEYSLTPRRESWTRPFARFYLQAQVMFVALVATGVAALVGRTEQPQLPHAGRQEGGPMSRGIEPEIRGRWYLSTIATPSVHPFQTVRPSASVNQYIVAHTNIAPPSGLPAGHTNNAQFHSNVPGTGIHSNVVLAHSNTAASHTNNDTRPNAGPL